MVKVNHGIKRSCAACGMRYYDMNRSPITCPSCGVEFDPESLLKTRKSQQAAKAANDDQEEGAEAVTADSDDATPAAKAAVIDADLEENLDFDEDDVDVDNEEAGLISDDIAADDELLTNIPDSDEG